MIAPFMRKCKPKPPLVTLEAALGCRLRSDQQNSPFGQNPVLRAPQTEAIVSLLPLGPALASRLWISAPQPPGAKFRAGPPSLLDKTAADLDVSSDVVARAFAADVGIGTLIRGAGRQ
jgi:hypothetical protein